MKEAAVLIAIATITAIVVAILMAFPVYLLWNWLLPTLFDFPIITFWEALGISMLCSLLFKSTSSTKSS